MIARHFTETGVAFCLVTKDEPEHDGIMPEPVVLIYDLEHIGTPLPGEPEISGAFMASYYASALVDWEDEFVLGGVVITRNEMRSVSDFLAHSLVS